MWSYEDALAWLYARQKLGVKLGLDNMHALLAALEHPEAGLQFVHVAGTNGKGTVTTLLADALQRSGHKTGAFTSPHLTHFGERITVAGEPIAPDAVAAGLATIKPHAEAVGATFFEATLALALVHFQQQGVEWVALETGLGGRLDATNVVTPALTIITNIALDHTDMLGETEAKVAAEKAGIMKPGVPLVTGATGAALGVLKQRSVELKVPMGIVGQDHHVLPEINGFRVLTARGEAYYELGLAGAHQIQNAALVVAAADVLPISAAALHQALKHGVMPGRLETVAWQTAGRTLDVLLDGAHNEDGAAALRHHLGNLNWAGFDLIVGFHKDKDWPRMVQQWAPLARRIWGVPLRSERTLDPRDMAGAFDIIPFQTAKGVAHALESAAEAGATKVVIAGSLWLVGEARAHLLGLPMEEIRGNQ